MGVISLLTICTDPSGVSGSIVEAPYVTSWRHNTTGHSRGAPSRVGPPSPRMRTPALPTQFSPTPYPPPRTLCFTLNICAFSLMYSDHSQPICVLPWHSNSCSMRPSVAHQLQLRTYHVHLITETLSLIILPQSNRMCMQLDKKMSQHAWEWIMKKKEVANSENYQFGPFGLTQAPPSGMP